MPLKVGQILTNEDLINLMGSEKQKNNYKLKRMLQPKTKKSLLKQLDRYCKYETGKKGKLITYKITEVFNETKDLPFKGDNSVFRENILETKDDDEFFKELRASFGAHPSNLNNGRNREKKRYASWSIQGNIINENYDWTVLLYSNQTNEKDVYLGVNICDLKLYFEKRYRYIEEIIKKIDKLEFEFIEEMRQLKIKESVSPTTQLLILREENKIRMNADIIEELIEQMLLFLKTSFYAKDNQKKVLAFKKKLIHGIKEIKYVLQNMDYNFTLEISELLNPKNKPTTNMYEYEYANLYSSIFTNNHKPYFKQTLIEPLKTYISFNYKTEVEFYFLVIIALNLGTFDNF